MTSFSFHCSEYGRSKGSLRGLVDPEACRLSRSCRQSQHGGAEDTGCAEVFEIMDATKVADNGGCQCVVSVRKLPSYIYVECGGAVVLQDAA